MRVVAGSAKGSGLISPDGLDFRPTLDRVKEAVFSMLSGVEAPKVLDLFSGSGALGIEALSRGAESCVFVDKSRKSLDITRKNLEKTHLLSRAKIVLNDFEAFLKNNTESFNLVFLDPPYKDGLIPRTLELLKNGALAEGALVVCETDDKLKCEIPAGYLPIKEKKYGRCRIIILEKNFQLGEL